MNPNQPSIRQRSFYSARKLVWILWILTLTPIVSWAQSTSEALRQNVEFAHDSGELEIAGSRLVAVDFLARFYQGRHFAPAWTDPNHVDTVVHALETSGQHGLSAADFHTDAIRTLRNQLTAQPEDPLVNAHLDLLLTDGLITYAYQLVYGKVDPRAHTASWNLNRPLLKRPPEEILEETLGNGKLVDVLGSLAPDFSYYQRMQAQLQRYRRIAAEGGWPAIPAGKTLKPGDVDPRVAALRDRLAAEFGDIDAQNDEATVFDETLEQAVRRFQQTYGLEVDGAVGPATLRAMNISAEQRVDQIRVNMERARWVREEFVNIEDFVVVNIAGFYVRLVKDGARSWETRAIVGTQYHKTPLFAADMKYVVFNPTWTVPRSIIRNEMMRKMKADPNYLPSRHFDLVDRSGKTVDPASLDWPNVSARNFPYNVVQRPGTWNALGLVKFILPNSHSVYLHDTPSRQLFARSGRTFSHGCVRTQNPLDLAQRLLADKPDWKREAIDRTIESGKTKTVYLTEPLRVFILYWTAEPTDDGGARFYEDVYERDGVVLAALDEPFRRLTPADREN